MRKSYWERRQVLCFSDLSIRIVCFWLSHATDSTLWAKSSCLKFCLKSKCCIEIVYNKILTEIFGLCTNENWLLLNNRNLLVVISIWQRLLTCFQYNIYFSNNRKFVLESFVSQSIIYCLRKLRTITFCLLLLVFDKDF